jgi:hypothetical protein
MAGVIARRAWLFLFERFQESGRGLTETVEDKSVASSMRALTETTPGCSLGSTGVHAAAAANASTPAVRKRRRRRRTNNSSALAAIGIIGGEDAGASTASNTWTDVAGASVNAGESAIVADRPYPPTPNHHSAVKSHHRVGPSRCPGRAPPSKGAGIERASDRSPAARARRHPGLMAPKRVSGDRRSADEDLGVFRSDRSSR